MIFIELNEAHPIKKIVCLYAKLMAESTEKKYILINIIYVAIIITQIFSFAQWLGKRITQ